MLKEVRLKNFKLHEDTTIEVAPITVFIGPNNSGKSSIFQALLALRQACALLSPYFLQPPEQFAGHRLIDIGGFQDVVRRGRDEIEIGVSGSVSSLRPSSLGEVRVSIDVQIRDNVLASHEGKLDFAGGQLEWKHVARAPSAFPQPSVTLDIALLKFTPVDHFGLIQPVAYELPPDAGADPAWVSGLTQAASSLAAAHIELLKSLRPIYPLRGFEEWGSELPEQPAENVERSTLYDRSVAISSLLASNASLRRQVSERLQELLGIGVDIEIVGGNRIKVYGTSTPAEGAGTLFANEGTGANQLPFILVPIGLAKPHETILLAEPEAHLHPKGQSELTGRLLEIANKQSLQFVIETHSEHVLHKLLHAVAKGDLATENLAIYYFENQNGQASVKPLRVDERGGVEDGLPGFYDQSLEELSEYLDALKAKT